MLRALDDAHNEHDAPTGFFVEQLKRVIREKAVLVKGGTFHVSTQNWTGYEPEYEPWMRTQGISEVEYVLHWGDRQFSFTITPSLAPQWVMDEIQRKADLEPPRFFEDLLALAIRHSSKYEGDGFYRVEVPPDWGRVFRHEYTNWMLAQGVCEIEFDTNDNDMLRSFVIMYSPVWTFLTGALALTNANTPAARFAARDGDNSILRAVRRYL